MKLTLLTGEPRFWIASEGCHYGACDQLKRLSFQRKTLSSSRSNVEYRCCVLGSFLGKNAWGRQKTELKLLKVLLDEALKRLRGVLKTKRHSEKLKMVEWCDDCCFANICWSDWNLVVTFGEIDLGEDCSRIDRQRKSRMNGYRSRVFMFYVLTMR